MAKLTLVALMAAVLAIIRACTFSPLDTDTGEPVSYDGTVESISLQYPTDENSEQQSALSTTITIKGCVRASIVRDATQLKVSVRSCNGTSLDYERELAEALGELETNRFGIFRKEQGLVKFFECLSSGGSFSFYLALEKQCSASNVCRVFASGRKELAISQFGLMRSFDARNMLPNGDNAGCLIGGQASAMIVGILVYVFQYKYVKSE
ncbi:hypothetical protein pipiens_018665 [Culex pipiens pipiens]|uniref:Uncharacterized protein n=1 Tax=Culex pipiens pipiens TaxID=38569 RepID=A0ABD1CAM1_CULPP